MAGKYARFRYSGTRDLHVIEGADPVRAQVRAKCGLIQSYREVTIAERHENSKCCPTCVPKEPK
jgi:hypothetical protein